MKKVVSIILAGVMGLSLTACGEKENGKENGKENKEVKTNIDEKFVGEWIGVGGDAFGITMTAEDAAAYELLVDASGKASLVADGDPLETTCKTDGDTITLKSEELDMETTGTLTDGAIFFEDLMGLGINIYFAQEGTDAADSSLYIPEADKAMLGTWKSYEVKNILDEDMSSVVPADALVMTFNGDYTVDIEFNGEKIEGETWILSDGFGYLTDSDYDISWDVVDDEIVVSYYTEELYKFTCAK